MTFENCWVMGRVRFGVIQFWVTSGFRAVGSDSFSLTFQNFGSGGGRFGVDWADFSGE